MTTEPRQLDPDIIERLRDLGIDNPNPDDPLHKKLVQTMYRTRALPVGQQIVAVKFDINSELRDAGARFAKAKTDYDHYIDKEATRIRLAEGEKSGEMAIRRANASDEAYRLLLTYRLAEQQERALRKYLDTLDNQVEVWRTLRADERKADEMIARGTAGA